jgi:hypothetical protein
MALPWKPDMTSHTNRRIPALAVAAVLGAALGGCAGSPVPAAAPGGTLILTCHDSAGQQPADPAAKLVNGAESSALDGDTNAYDSLPVWVSRDGHRYLIWKTFLAVAPTARPYRLISVSGPASARLFYASPARWGAASGSKAIAPPSRRVRLPSCGHQYTGYTGGILVTHPECVTLSVAGPRGKPTTVTVPILTPSCDPQ